MGAARSHLRRRSAIGAQPSIGSPRRAAVIAYNDGVRLAKEGKVNAAAEAFECTIRSGHPALGPRAAFNLGVLLNADPDAAAGAYRRAAATAHPEVAPKALFNLGCLLTTIGDPERAKEAFEHAIRLGDVEVFTRSVLSLAALQN